MPPILARSYPRGTRLGLHVHREAQLLFSASGVMQVGTPQGIWLVPPARAVWLPPGVEHSVDVLADIEMRALLVPPEWLRDHAEAVRLDREFIVAVGPLLRELILAAFQSGSPAERTRLLFGLALYELAETRDAGTFLPLPADARARRVADMVLADLRANDDLEFLAQAAGASARTISRLFPAETHLTFKAWRQRARMVAAVEALGDERVSIKQVAARLGFSSVAAFGYSFKQVMGVTPSEMLRRPAR